MRKYLLILGIPSIVLLFLPYASGVSPGRPYHRRLEGLPFPLLGGPLFLTGGVLGVIVFI